MANLLSTLAKNYRRYTVAGVLLLVMVALMVAGSFFVIHGSKTAIVLAALIVLLPAAVFAFIARPVIFPYSLYAFLVPFDAILNYTAVGTLTRLLAIASGAALLFWLIRQKQVVPPPRALFLWGLLIFWAAMSLFWALDLQNGSHLFLTLLQLFGLYTIVSVFPISWPDFRFLIVALGAGAGVAAAYGAYLFHSGVGLLNERLFIQSETGVITPNHFAAGLLLPLAIVALFAFRARWSVKKLLLAALALLLVSGIYFGASRAGSLSVAAMLVYFFCRTRYKVQILICALLALCIGFAENTALWSRFAEAGSSGGSGRLDIWRVGVVAFKDHWLTGAGIGGFQSAFDQAILLVHQHFYTNWHRAPHNLILQSAVELGVIGLALTFVAVVVQFRVLSEIDRGQGVYYELRIAMEAAIVSLIVSAMFADIMYQKYTWLAFSTAAMVRSLWMVHPKRLFGFPFETTSGDLVPEHPLRTTLAPIGDGNAGNVPSILSADR